MLTKKSHILLVVLSLIVGTSAIGVNRSHAAALVAVGGLLFNEEMMTHDPDQPSDLSPQGRTLMLSTIGACFLSLGILGPHGVLPCFLSEDAASLKLTAEYFTENGYSSDEEAAIREEHARFVEAAKSGQLKLDMRRLTSQDAVTAEMQKILPDVSEVYTRYVSETLGLQ